MPHLFRIALILLAISLPLASQAQLERYKDSLNGSGMVTLRATFDALEIEAVGEAWAGEPITSQHRFCIGSCTKMFTAALVMMLAEQDQLAISDSIGKYLPAHPNIAPDITIQQLLNHSSGIANFTENGYINEPFHFPHAFYNDETVLQRVDSPSFSPGTQTRYSNTNYLLLRRIIEVVADQPYEAALRERILEPLNLRDTYTYYGKNIPLLAHPMINGEDLHNIPKLGSNTISRGVGNLVTTAYDLNTFIRALLIDRTLISDPTLYAMTAFENSEDKDTGLGLFAERCGGRTLIGHTGRQVSYIAYAFADIQEGISYVILCNDANNDYTDAVFEGLCH